MTGADRVLLVEDEPEVRTRLARAITDDPQLQLLGAAGTCAEARRLLQQCPPEVLLVDLGLPDGRGADLIREALALRADTQAMVITVFGDEAHVVEALEAGASSYLLKDASAAQVARAIREMLDGGSPMSPRVARYLLQRWRDPVAATPAPEGMDARARATQDAVAAPLAAPAAPRFSEREADVLDLVAKGYAYAEIGNALGISINTVGTYVKQIYRKLAVTSRGEAVFEAMQSGLIGTGAARTRPH